MSSSGSLRCGEVSDRLTGSTRTVQVHPRSSVKRQNFHKTANDVESRRSHISIMQKIKMGLSDSLSVKSTISPVSLGADLQRDGTLQHNVYLVGIRLICKAAKWQNNQKCDGFFFFLLLTFFLQREVLDDSLTTFPCVQCQYIFLLSLIRRPHVLLQCCQGQATKTTWQRSGESRNYGRIVLKVRNGTQREGLVLPCTCTHPSACAQVVFTSWTNKSVFTINLSEYVQ